MKRLALAAFLMASAPAWAADYSIMAPAAPGGGWDQTARTMQTLMQQEGISGNVQVTNVPGAGGTIGLAQFVNQAKGDPEDLIVGGYVMVGAILTNNSPVDLSMVTPIARLTGEQEAIVVPASSDIQTIDDLVAKLKADPGAVSWGGGSAGGADHILAGLVAKAAGVDPTKVNYIAFSGGGEALAAILGGQVTVGVSGSASSRARSRPGQLRLLAVSGEERVEGVDAPTLKEAGVDVALENWRMVAAAPGITDEQKAAITRRHREARHLRRLEAGARHPRLGRPLPGRPGLREAARRRHRGDQAHPDRDRPGAMSAPGSQERRPDGAALVIAAAARRRWRRSIFWQTRAMPVTAQYARVGPTTMPYVMSGFLAAARGRPRPRRRSATACRAREADRPGPMLWIVGGLVLQMLLLKPLGFSIATGLLFAFTARGFGKGPLWMTVPLGIVAVARHLADLRRPPQPLAARRAARAALLLTRGDALMDTFALLAHGLAGALQPINLLYALIGVTLGTAVGVLPGIGPALTVALLLPVTYQFDPTASLIMFAGIYYGGMYGGSTTSILLNTPGESASIVTALEGNKMARKGRGGPALATAAIGSFVAGLIATFGLAFISPWMVKFALSLGPADYFALMVLAFVTVSAAFGDSALRGLTALALGPDARARRHRPADRAGAARPSASPTCSTASR